MRKSSVMNDFSEVRHGWECLKDAYASEHGARLHALLDRVSPDLRRRLEELFNGHIDGLIDNTYLGCFSLHAAHEEHVGRLSMWRAYGSSSRVALVLNNTPFTSTSDALGVYSSAVQYLSGSRFVREFDRFVDGLLAEEEFLQGIDEELLLAYLFTAFKFSVLCTKHPGFQEEAEIRAMFNPTLEPSERVTRSVEVVNGIPQLVAKVKLVNYPDEGLVGLDLASFLHQVIVGPTSAALEIREAFVSLLSDKGIERAEERVVVSQIPLRC